MIVENSPAGSKSNGTIERAIPSAKHVQKIAR